VTETPGSTATALPPRTVLGSRLLAVLGVVSVGLGILTLALPAAPFSPFLIAVGYLTVVGVWLAIIDWRSHFLPNWLMFPSYAVVLCLLAMHWIATSDPTAVLRAVITAALTFALYSAMAFWGSLGGGDVKLGALLALVLGWASIDTAIAGPILGFLLGAVVAIILLVLGRSKTAHLAFGPYLIAGALLALARHLFL
jgi:leader peptidase (prepilin peptidase)/N-methyltransferase